MRRGEQVCTHDLRPILRREGTVAAPAPSRAPLQRPLLPIPPPHPQRLLLLGVKGGDARLQLLHVLQRGLLARQRGVLACLDALLRRGGAVQASADRGRWSYFS